MQYKLAGSEDGSNLTVYPGEGKPLQAHSSHPNWDAIIKGVLADDPSVFDLFDVALAAGTKFERLSDRITSTNGKLFLDGVEFNNALAEQVVRFVGEGVEDWKPLVNFYELVLANPNEHSREQLYTWLAAEDFTITPEGFIVGYKSVNGDAKSGFKSVNTSGSATVDGVLHKGAIPQPIGGVVEMPRDAVAHNPREACSTGLHVGTRKYADDFTGNTVLEVHVNPRDVVSVPTDAGGSKMRVCRYKVVAVSDTKRTSVLAPSAPKTKAKKVATVKKGDVFADRDSRRAGRTFKVEAVVDGVATGKSLPLGVTRQIRVDRLLSRKYAKQA